MAPNTRLYFAYGSNLSLEQMASRCPTSVYHSFGLLRNYKWVIGERGYANVLKTDPAVEAEEHVVYGMLYTLEAEDEMLLDLAEGVPYAYEKHVLEVEVLSPAEGKVEALVYVDVRRLGEGICPEEYVGRINRGIKDAVRKGMKEDYVQRYVRPFVPARQPPVDEIYNPFHSNGSEISS